MFYGTAHYTPLAFSSSRSGNSPQYITVFALIPLDDGARSSFLELKPTTTQLTPSAGNGFRRVATFAALRY